jgi:Icc-related predicted phosphoesterase
MRIGFLGDLHGEFYVLDKITKTAKDGGVELIIQVGDFGFYPRQMAMLMETEIHVPIYCIDGNHENFEFLYKLIEGFDGDVVPIKDEKVWYVKRGSVVDIDGKKFGFLGGAASVDKAWRTPLVDWFPGEQITDEEIARFDNVDKLDYLIVHTPPHCIVRDYFDPNSLLMFGLPITWTDPSAHKVEALWERLNRPMLYCGHMHRKVLSDDHKCRVLDIEELVYEDI